MNKFNVDPQEVDEVLQLVAKTAETFKQQPYRGIAGSSTFVCNIIWESAAHCKLMFSRPKVRSNIANVPPNTVMSPHLFKKVAVPRICVD